jgi:hypothetical protein
VDGRGGHGGAHRLDDGGLEGDDGGGAQVGVHRRERDVGAVDGDLAVARGQPVGQGRLTHQLLVVLLGLLLRVLAVGLLEVEVGQPVVEDDADDVAVQPRRTDRRGVVDLLHDLWRPGLARVDHHDAGARGLIGLVAPAEVAQDDDSVSRHEDLAVAQVRELERRKLLRLVPGHVKGGQHVVLDPEELVPGDLDHVGLVDAGLLDVGAGLVAGRTDRGGDRCRSRRHPFGAAGRVAALRPEHDDRAAAPAVGGDKVESAVDVRLEKCVAVVGEHERRGGQLEGAGGGDHR